MVNRVDAETYAEHDMNENEARGLKASLHKLVEAINDVELNSQDTITRSGGYIFTLLKETNVSHVLNAIVRQNIFEVLRILIANT